MHEELLYKTYYEKIFPLIKDVEIYRRELCNQLILRSILFSSIFSVLLGVIVYFEERNIIYAISFGIVSMIVFFTANFLLQRLRRDMNGTTIPLLRMDMP